MIGAPARSILRGAALAAALLALSPLAAHAYVGPGAGFAVVGSLGFIFVTFFLALIALVTWPFRAVYRAIRRIGRRRRTDTHRVIILGLDGLDPTLARRWMDEGHLPHFKALAEQGSFHELATSFPAMSPVAWSCFATGVDAAKHNIFDFLGRDLRTHMPILSSTDIRPPTRTLKLGRYELPLNKPTLRLLRRSKTFWRLLGENFVPCHVLRVPITFPPEKVPNGALLSAMCVPDLRGTQGSFTLFTTDAARAATMEGGTVIVLKREGTALTGEIPGPANPITREHALMTLPFRLEPTTEGGATLLLEKKKFALRPGEFSDWVTLTFRPGLGQKVRGIVRFRVMASTPEFDLYMTAINLDPESPAMPISEPGFFAQYLARLNGPYATLGLAEDTWALNERVLDDEAFLDYAWKIHDEREKMWFNSLRKNRRGLNLVVFDATDRIQHMFFRTVTPDHPANRAGASERHRDAMLDLYRRADDLLARTLKFVDERTVLFVLSDHGFKPFKRGINLNAWFLQNGYMAGKNGGGVGRYFEGVDWPRTRAYTFGLGGVFLNVKGRETDGAVAAGDEYRALKAELIEKLSGLRDPATGEAGIGPVYDGAEVFRGPYRDQGPDLVIGYNPGYRTSWDGAVGAGGGAVFEDNTKAWSGDHCMDPMAVPGVLFCNRKLATDYPSLMDIGPTTLALFGVKRPEYVDGCDLLDPAMCGKRASLADAYFPLGVPAGVRREGGA
jgi:predicted AlkP superfamily phosphohydrolase/phosphomutase